MCSSLCAVDRNVVPYKSPQCTKYLAITLLVIQLLAVVAVWLFYFQLKNVTFALSFGGVGLVSLLASGELFRRSRTPAITTKEQTAIPIAKLMEQWVKDKCQIESVWNERVKTAMLYWEKFGLDPEIIWQDYKDSVAPAHQLLRLRNSFIYGIDGQHPIDETQRNFINDVHNQDFSQAYASVHWLTQNHPINQVVVIQALKICISRKQLKEANGILTLFIKHPHPGPMVEWNTIKLGEFGKSIERSEIENFPELKKVW